MDNQTQILDGDRLFRAVLFASPDGVVILNSQGLIELASSSALKMFGYTMPEAIHRMPSEFILPEGRNLANANIERILKEGISLLTEFTATRSDGSLINIEVNGEAIWESYDNISGVILIIRDITKRKKDEEKIFKSEELHRSILKASPDAIFVADSNGYITMVSPASLELFGYNSDEELIGKHILSFVSPEDFERAKESLSKRRPAEGSGSNEYKCIHSDGRPIYVEANMEFICNSPKDTAGIVIIARDITNRKAAEERLKFSEMRLNLALEGSNAGVWDVNVQTNEAYFSPRCRTILGYLETEISNQLEEWESLIHPQDIKNYYQKVSGFLSGKAEIFYNEHRVHCKDGTYKWVLDRGKVVSWNKKGKPARIVGIIRDITKQREYETMICQAKEAADAANQSTQKFLSVIAHEFNTPLGLLTMSVDVLDRYGDKLDEETRTKIRDKIRSASRQMSQLVKSVKDFSYHKTDYNCCSISRIDILDFCQSLSNEVGELFSRAPLFTAKIPIKYRKIDIKETLLRRILVNLLSNAFRYTSSDEKVVLHITCQNKFLYIIVADNGIGIPKAEIERVCDAFYRGSNVGTRSGLGLGLSIISDSLRKLGGTLKIKSCETKGTIFKTRIPLYSK